ncbi:unnamed protein product [Cladocopium goreaui]|uniref:Uncharacterized protein n=1 Tax=Cladocopium goreaui TaxID=2562237 RepID=A0A9P1FU87_9DINO|nr:unnamed protein product [Cladocopium goreaui]
MILNPDTKILARLSPTLGLQLPLTSCYFIVAELWPFLACKANTPPSWKGIRNPSSVLVGLGLQEISSKLRGQQQAVGFIGLVATVAREMQKAHRGSRCKEFL